jgi:uncharacterized protein YfiM (DUF2279 family)
MAKVFGPGLAVDAKGKIGKGIAFQGRPKGTAAIKRPVASKKSLDEPTTFQQTQRDKIKARVEAWQAMSEADRESWGDLAKNLGKQLSGYHYYMTFPEGEPSLYLLTEAGDYLLQEDSSKIILE